ncbi:ankyrin repeat-containing protein ITN1-like protein [Tanacetum coccineum]|uniref:Ankyrin repeat-containing protein ITN1-like protein n=1 Tax=Tanacetum coccineum TaxID=301880 RepID=A0ABQ4XEC1_9ASTR
MAGRGGRWLWLAGGGCGVVGRRWWSDKIWWSEGEVVRWVLMLVSFKGLVWWIRVVITTLYSAAKKEHLEVMKELLKYSDKKTLTRRSRLEFDPLHIAASEGHHDHHKETLLLSLLQLQKNTLLCCCSGATVKDPSLLDIPRSNGITALHLAARLGHVETLKTLLDKDPQLARRTGKKHIGLRWWWY